MGQTQPKPEFWYKTEADFLSSTAFSKILLQPTNVQLFHWNQSLQSLDFSCSRVQAQIYCLKGRSGAALKHLEPSTLEPVGQKPPRLHEQAKLIHSPFG